jgi:hypothetical protein
VGRSSFAWGGCVDEAGGVTPERPRRFELLASFSLQSFAARAHTTSPESRRSGRGSFFVIRPFEPTCHCVSHVRARPGTVNSKATGARQNNKTLDVAGGHYFWCFGATRRPAHDGLRRPTKPALQSRSVPEPIHVRILASRRTGEDWGCEVAGRSESRETSMINFGRRRDHRTPRRQYIPSRLT